MQPPAIAKKARIGILSAGHRRYWGQFEGSREAVIAGAQRLRAIVEETGAAITMPDLVDATELSFEAGRQFEQAGIDLLFVDLHTYVASGFWIPGLMRLNVPIVLVCLPASFDMEQEYITGTAIRLGSPCQLPEAFSALRRVGKEPSDIVFGDPGRDLRVRAEIHEWCAVATVLATYRNAIFGYLGHTYDGMLDMNFDPTAITGRFGIYCRMLEMCELARYVEEAADRQVQEKIVAMHEMFDFVDRSGDPITRPASAEDIGWAARCAVGLDRLVDTHQLAGLAYYYEGEDNLYEQIGANLIIGNTMLTSRGISLAGEADMKNCIAMKTTSALGAGGSFAELSIVDFERQQVYVGHDGPHDIRITDSRPLIRGLNLYHGKKGQGIAVEFGIKKGDISLVSLALDGENRFKWVVAEGQSMPGRLPQIANSVTRGLFGDDVSRFIRAWSMSGVSHHFSLCVGHVATRVQKLGKAMNIEVQIVR